LETDKLVIKGAREHNLKNVTVEIPKKQLVVFSGVSGSGKSSLAFDTLYAEGRRRYVESLSAYARQFLGQMEKPRYDAIHGLSPTISIEQRSSAANPRSTVGTTTEILDYLRVLFARAGVQHCPRCGERVGRLSAQEIVEAILGFPTGETITLYAPRVSDRKGEHREIFTQALESGFTRVRVDGRTLRLEKPIPLDRNVRHTIEIVVDRIQLRENIRQRVTDSVETALRAGAGSVRVATEKGKETVFSELNACPACGIGFPELSPQLFSFNSPAGMCEECNGLGTRMRVDLELLCPDPGLSLQDGAIALFRSQEENRESWGRTILKGVARKFGIPWARPFRELTEKQRNILLYGCGEERIPVSWKSTRVAGSLQMKFEGVIPLIERRLRETKSDAARRYYMKFFSTSVCPACGGNRLKPAPSAVRVDGKTIVEISRMTIAQLESFLRSLQLAGAKRIIAEEINREILSRLRFLSNVGLDYLTLDRPSPTLSGGEAQRIKLASQIGSELSGVIYILDEPSIGLHQVDNGKLINTLRHLKEIGNTVIVVEHDAETINAADFVLDFGPGAGLRGGEIVFTGTPARIRESAVSLTGLYLSGKKKIDVPGARRRPVKGFLSIEGATLHNLKNIDVRFPVGLFICVTGVSGAGKSSLVNGILYPALARVLYKSQAPVGPHKRVEGLRHIDRVIHIDQRPIGQTPRSNPATYVKLFDLIREIFSQLQESKAYGYRPGRFSFNVKGGRCEACLGDGMTRIEMHFLPDVYVPCDVCRGKRFNEATLKVRFKGLNIAEVLELSVDEALDLFANHPRLKRKLQTLADVGLGYIKLGQSSPTLSGGEAQRIKLARELSKAETGRTLYVLDEPTTGLHFDDIRKLLDVLNRLVDAGNTVIVIEHNLEVIKCADHIVDLGPEGGEKGGRVVAEGTPEAISASADSCTGRYLKKVLDSAGAANS
jgi:excinuclease ABC subunit A